MNSNSWSYRSGTSQKPLLGLTIGEAFDQIVEQFANNEALIVRHQNIRYTYSELKTKVDDCAKALIAVGVRKRDRVGMWAPNCAEWTITQFATSKIGAILVNINPSYRLHELEYALNQSGCSVLVIADRFKKSNYTEMLYDLVPKLYHCEPGQLDSEKIPTLKTVIRLHNDNSPGMFTWNDFILLADSVTSKKLQKRQSQLSFDDPINIQYTSGTTGYPKGTALSHHNILNNSFFVTEVMKFTEKDRLIIPVPLYHCFGMVLGNLGCMTHGATMIYPSESFDPKAVLETIQEEKATVLYGVPTMFIAELEHPDFEKYDYSSLRTGIMAGSPCPVEVMKKVNKLMHIPEMTIAYGLTEASPVCTQTKVDASLEKRVNTVGQVLPHIEIKIVDPETGHVVPIEETGEFCARGYCVMLEYWKNQEQTNKAIDDGGWLHSGDLATMDEEGYVKIVGRIKDMVIRGGENIYPREIEEFLHAHPKIKNVQIIGVPDKKYGEELMAWIQLRDGETSTTEEIQHFCKDKIAYYKIPRYIKFVDSFPLTVTGKVRKVEMRQISIKELHLESVSS
jgi:fatty-acyl-CoA synthase